MHATKKDVRLTENSRLVSEINCLKLYEHILIKDNHNDLKNVSFNSVKKKKIHPTKYKVRKESFTEGSQTHTRPKWKVEVDIMVR